MDENSCKFCLASMEGIMEYKFRQYRNFRRQLDRMNSNMRLMGMFSYSIPNQRKEAVAVAILKCSSPLGYRVLAFVFSSRYFWSLVPFQFQNTAWVLLREADARTAENRRGGGSEMEDRHGMANFNDCK